MAQVERAVLEAKLKAVESTTLRRRMLLVRTGASPAGGRKT